MSNLDTWNNPMHSMELRLIVAIAEITKLREQLTAVTKERDELVAMLTKIQPGSELGTFLQNAEMPWAVCKDLAEMDAALAKVGADTTGETK